MNAKQAEYVSKIKAKVTSVAKTLLLLENTAGEDTQQHTAAEFLLPILDSVEQCFSLCVELTSKYDESHDAHHHYAVLMNALDILQFTPEVEKLQQRLETATSTPQQKLRLLKLLVSSSLLHDTVDPKYVQDQKESNQVWSKLDRYFEQYCTPEDDITTIKWLIENISYSKEAQQGSPPTHSDRVVLLARHILSDADKLEAIGPVGLQRCIQYTHAKYPGKFAVEIQEHVVQHCYDKLLKLAPQYIQTQHGKQLAEPLHKYIVDFVNASVDI